MGDDTDRRDGHSHLYYGPGKGKTTAAMGLAMRAAGRDLSVSVLQFMKGHEDVGRRYGEIEVLRERDGIDVRQFPTRYVEGPDDFTESEREKLVNGIETAEEVVSTGEADLVVLDELTLVWTFELVESAALERLFDRAAPTVELVVTGRDAPAALVDAADYVTYMAEIKHPFRQGTTARAGIEY